VEEEEEEEEEWNGHIGLLQELIYIDSTPLSFKEIYQS
jgi:hypothetical protein